MRRTAGFKTRASTYTIGHAPTSRATCRACRSVVGKGEMRIVTHAFVRPGRTHDFVCHLKCVTSALVKAMVGVYGSVKRVPTAKGIDGEELRVVCEELERKAA